MTKQTIEELNRKIIQLQDALINEQKFAKRMQIDAHTYCREVIALNNSIAKKAKANKFYKLYIDNLHDEIDSFGYDMDCEKFFQEIKDGTNRDLRKAEDAI